MELWRYTAIRNDAGQTLVPRRGELMAESAAEVRASLLRIGWQVVDLRQARKPLRLPIQLGEVWNRHLRRRRRDLRAEIYEGLCSLLESGLPLVECLEVMGMEEDRWSNRSRRAMLVQWRESMRRGASPSESIAAHRDWFDAMDCAMIEAGQHGGTLPTVLKHMAQREERSGKLGHQLITALTYPAIITLAAVGVAIFLSVKTLPDLTHLLTMAHLDTPRLTLWVMAVGQFTAKWGLMMLILVIALVGFGALLWRAMVNESPRAARFATSRTPRLFRTWAVAQLSQNLADLLRAGVPAVEALRVLAGTLSPALARVVMQTASEIEQGQDLAAALHDPNWFSAQFQRLVHSGQAAGELESTLERLAQRDERRTERQLNRLAALLEPAAILTLATLVGTVVLAAILPLTRLQEVIR